MAVCHRNKQRDNQTMATAFAHELGSMATDRITGFVGTIVGRSEWTTGCRQYCLCPKLAKDGAYRESVWFDEDRISCESKDKHTYENPARESTIGGPISRSMPTK